MALNMSDPGAVMSVYASILNNECNWLLLHYVSESLDEVGLHSYGRDGLEELKTKLSDDKAFLAFYREEVDINPGFIIINYAPPSISGVRRARASVHARRVGVIFKQHQTILSVDRTSLLTTENIHQAIVNPDLPLRSLTTHSTTFDPTLPSSPQDERDTPTFDSFQQPTPAQLFNSLQPVRPGNLERDSLPKSITRDMARRSFTATYAPDVQPPGVAHSVPPLPQKGGSLFTTLLRRKKRNEYSFDDVDSSDLPPPTPPKDKGSTFTPQPVVFSHSLPVSHPPYSQSRQTLHHQRSRSLSDFAVISHVRGSDEIIIESETYKSFTLRPSGKWSHDVPNDSAERARRRQELQLQRRREEEEALEQEAERQRQLRQQKEESERLERLEEAQRKVDTEREIRRITAERRRREALEKQEDERKRQEIEERKRLDRERRMEEHRRLEAWRIAYARKEESAARQAAEAKRLEEAERKARIQQAATKLKHAEESELTGWITLQSADSLSWKRKFYKFVGSTVYLYRSPKDLTTIFKEVNLHGQLRGLKEWNEGYDYLESIPFSFVVEFKDDRSHWSMFADSEEEKYKILGLFKMAVGL